MKQFPLVSTAYLAPISYYSLLAAYPQVRIERHEHYLKQTLRNRCLIASPEGSLPLTIPIVRNDPSHTEIKDIQISDHSNWQHQHWQALVTAYEASPYFEFYADDFLPFYEHPWKYLFDFNEAMRQKICELIDLQVKVSYTDKYEANVLTNEKRAGFSLIPLDWTFQPRPYYQVFQQKYGFLPDLSIADLLFNMGPESILYL